MITSSNKRAFVFLSLNYHPINLRVEQPKGDELGGREGGREEITHGKIHRTVRTYAHVHGADYVGKGRGFNYKCVCVCVVLGF